MGRFLEAAFCSTTDLSDAESEFEFVDEADCEGEAESEGESTETSSSFSSSENGDVSAVRVRECSSEEGIFSSSSFSVQIVSVSQTEVFLPLGEPAVEVSDVALSKECLFPSNVGDVEEIDFVSNAATVFDEARLSR